MNKIGSLVLLWLVIIIFICWLSSYFYVREQIDIHSFRLRYRNDGYEFFRKIHFPLRYLDRLFFKEEYIVVEYNIPDGMKNKSGDHEF